MSDKINWSKVTKIGDSKLNHESPDLGDPSLDGNVPSLCGRCYCETDELFPSGCSEDPEKLKGQPIGMYHCPDCGTMVLAGIPHPYVCKQCRDRQHPGFDEGIEK